MRLRRNDPASSPPPRNASDQAEFSRLERLQRRAHPDLGRDCLTFSFAVPAAAGAPFSSAAPAPRPAPASAGLKEKAAAVDPTAVAATIISTTSDESDLRQRCLREIERQVAQARAPLFPSSSSSPSSSGADAALLAAAANRDLDRAAGAFCLLSASSPSTRTPCSPWWALRARELDALGQARVRGTLAALAARDAERAALAAARVSAAVERAAAGAGRRRRSAALSPPHSSKPGEAVEAGGSVVLVLPRRAQEHEPSAAGAAAASRRPMLPPSAPQPAAAAAPHHPTRAQRRESERLAALELVWQAHRHVLLTAGATTD